MVGSPQSPRGCSHRVWSDTIPATSTPRRPPASSHSSGTIARNHPGLPFLGHTPGRPGPSWSTPPAPGCPTCPRNTAESRLGKIWAIFF